MVVYRHLLPPLHQPSSTGYKREINVLGACYEHVRNSAPPGLPQLFSEMSDYLQEKILNLSLIFLFMSITEQNMYFYLKFSLMIA